MHRDRDRDARPRGRLASLGRVLALGLPNVREGWAGADPVSPAPQGPLERRGGPLIGLLPICAPRPRDLSPAVTRLARTSERWRHFF